MKAFFLLILFLLTIGFMVSLKTDAGQAFWTDLREKVAVEDLIPTPENVRNSKIGHLEPLVGEAASLLEHPRKGESTMPPGKPLLICMSRIYRQDGQDSSKRFGEPPCVDYLTEKLPETMVPQDESEIGVVIGLYWGDYPAGRYQAQAASGPGSSLPGISQWVDGMRESCKVRVVNRRTGELIGEKELIADPPPIEAVVSPEHEELYGPSVEPLVLTFIQRLYQR